MGVKIEGMMLQNKAQLMSKTEAVLQEEKASAIMTISGGLVMIN